MAKMKEEEVTELLEKNPHLKEYIQKIEKK